MFLTRRRATTQDELSRLIDGFFGPAVAFRATSPDRQSVPFPTLDVSETDAAIHVSAELPGVSQKAIDIEILADQLRISGEKKDERVVDEHSFHAVERSFGKFDRVINLPAEVDGTKAEATFQDGVLTVNLPKLKPVAAQKISVKSVT